MTADSNPHLVKWRHFLEDCRTQVGQATPFQLYGRLTRINGLVM